MGIFSFQPSEFLKITFILYLASLLGSRIKNFKEKSIKSFKESLQNFYAFVGILIIITFLLMAQPDIGSLGVIALTGIIIYFLAFTPLWHSILLILGGITGFLLLVKIAPYRINRILVFLNP